jgi:ketosteroid isomerase-like protein
MTKPTSAIDTGNVKAANNAYYSALSKRDLQAMEKVWSCASDNILIAPPTNPLPHVGWDAIKQNWEIYWPTFSHFTVSMTVTAINIIGPVAWVHGIETSRRRSNTGHVSSSRNYGTNIFVNHDGRWLMAFHQSTAIPEHT